MESRRIKEIVGLVATRCDVTTSELVGASKRGDIPAARFLAYWLVRQTTEKSLPQIASEFGVAHHATVIYGIKRCEARRKVDPQWRALSDELLHICRR
jgi:chromosomal replication initiation ATPase DnaA